MVKHVLLKTAWLVVCSPKITAIHHLSSHTLYVHGGPNRLITGLLLFNMVKNQHTSTQNEHPVFVLQIMLVQLCCSLEFLFGFMFFYLDWNDQTYSWPINPLLTLSHGLKCKQIISPLFLHFLLKCWESPLRDSRLVNRCSRSGAGLHLRDKNALSWLWLVLKLAACGLRLRLGQGPGPKLALFLVSM